MTERRGEEIRERAFWPVAFAVVGVVTALCWADRADSASERIVTAYAIEKCANVENPSVCAEAARAIIKGAK